MTSAAINDPRFTRLSEPHLLPLTRWVELLRTEGLEVPDFDPEDGGVHARALFLLESPGPRAVQTRFVSRDNPDPSARNMAAALDLAGFGRSDTILWNVVPYCVSTRERNQNATMQQIRAAAPLTQALVDMLANLKAVTFCGRRAQVMLPLLKFGTGVRVFSTFHPGAQSFNRERCRNDVLSTFREVRASIQRPSSSNLAPAAAKV